MSRSLLTKGIIPKDMSQPLLTLSVDGDAVTSIQD